MPSEKRARQRAGRQARREAVQRREKRRRQLRTAGLVVVVAIIVIGSFYLITRKSPKTTRAKADSQAQLVNVWKQARCPASPTARVNTMHFSSAPAMTISTSTDYDATVKTDVGTFVIQMDPKVSPVAVNSFVFLAKQGFFNCVVFHRVIPGFVDQTGDPTATGTGGPGYQFTEAGPPNASPQYPLGAVAMANSDNPPSRTPHTNGSQWFVVTGNAGETLPPDYVIFGRVIGGMSVVQKINKDGSTTGTPPKIYHRMLKVTVAQT
ncbi:MAG: peptidylprolyl isomerase [Acidimicrobiales bacterium]